MGKYDLNSGNIITPVQSTFVDPGVETFKQAAMLYRQQYDKNKDAYNLTKRAMAQMELMPGDEKAGLRDQFTDQLDKNFEDILATGAFEDATNAVQANVDFVMTDKTVLQAQRNALEFKKEEALIDQFGPSGVLDFNKGLRESFTTVTTDAEGNQVVNSYREKMEQKEDYAAYMKTLIGTIAESGGGSYKGIDINGDAVMDYLQTGNTRGVSQRKMERVVEGLLNTYIDSKVGDQDLRRLTQIEGMNEEEAKANILDRMKGMGQSQVGMTTTVSHQQYKLGDRSSGNPYGSGLGTEDNWAINTLTDGKTNIGFNVFAEMTNSAVSDNIEGGVIVTGQKGIVTDFTKFLDESNKTNVNNALVENNLASNAEEASVMQEHLLKYLEAENQGDTEGMKRIAADMGISFDNEREKLQKLSKFVKGSMDTERLNMMGSLLNTEVSGVFRPSQGATANAQWINGNAVVDGEYWFTDEQMNNMASSMGIDDGTGGWFFGIDIFGDNLENVEDAQGNKIFRKETMNGEDYYVVRGKSQPIQGSKISGDALYQSAGHTAKQYQDNEITIRNQRDASLKIANSADFAFQNTINKIPGAGVQIAKSTKAVMNNLKTMPMLLAQPNPVQAYQYHANQVSNIIVNGYNQGKSPQEIDRDLIQYIENLNKPQ
tara:strand:- start:5491 stop:7464 length:1974 start_codon:yes stop_codon:yes gene_type:complete